MELIKAKSSPRIIEENKDIINFLGLNRLPITKKGELSAITNMSTKYVGCLCQRPPREVVHTLTNGKALASTSNHKLCWVDGTNFVYDGTTKGTVSAGAKSMIDFEGVILIFPDKKYYDYTSDTFGNIGSGSPADGEAPDPGQCPNMDMVCVFNNRVWGIKDMAVYGSKYDDPFEWGQFSTPIQEDDSVYFKIISKNGELVGIIPLENHILFNAEYSTYELYGNSPSNFDPQLITQSKGVLDAKSQVEVDHAVYELCNDGVNAYSGSKPRLISYELNEGYTSGAAGSDGRFYYISLYSGTEYNLYVYDTMLGLWSREDGLQVIDFTLMNGYLYALASDNKIYKFNSGTETIASSLETGKLINDYLGNKGTYEVKIEAEIELSAKINVYISINGREYALINTITDVGHKYHKACIIPEDAFYFKIKLDCIGAIKLYSIARDLIVDPD
jgi:hypothetical protein